MSSVQDSPVPVHPGFLQQFFLSEDQSTNGIEAPSPSTSTRWAAAPRWVIVI